MTLPIRRAAAVAGLLILAACGSPTPPPNLPALASPSPKVAPTGTSGTSASAPPSVVALGEARGFARTFFSPDYRTIDNYIDGVEAASTGAFRSDFVAKESQLRQMLTQVRSTATSQILASGVRESTPTSATVVAAVDQYVQNTTTGGKQVTNRYRIVERMRRIDGRWLVEDLEPVVDGVSGPGCPDPTTTPDRDELLRQSCSDIARLYSYDYSRIDADISTQRDVTTGSLRHEVDTSTGPALRTQAPQVHAHVAAQVPTAVIERLDGDEATLLLFVDQAVTTDKLPAPRLDRNRVEATVQRVNGQWLVSEVRAL